MHYFFKAGHRLYTYRNSQPGSASQQLQTHCLHRGTTGAAAIVDILGSVFHTMHIFRPRCCQFSIHKPYNTLITLLNPFISVSKKRPALNTAPVSVKSAAGGRAEGWTGRPSNLLVLTIAFRAGSARHGAGERAARLARF